MPALLLAVLTLALPGAATASPAASSRVSPLVGASASSVVSERIGGQRALVATPRAATDRVVVFAHGAGRDAAGLMNDAAPIVAALLAGGYTVVTSDAHGDAWGNPASRRDYVEVARAMRRRGLTHVFVLARSMGGLASLAALRQIAPEAWAGIYPACNLRSLGQFRHGIARAYHRPWARIARIPALNPIAPRGVRGMPMIFWASPADTVVSKRHNTDVCAAAARRAGARVTVVTTEGDHGDPSNMDPPRLLDFFDSAARQAPARGPRGPRGGRGGLPGGLSTLPFG